MCYNIYIMINNQLNKSRGDKMKTIYRIHIKNNDDSKYYFDYKYKKLAFKCSLLWTRINWENNQGYYCNHIEIIK